MTWVLVAAEFVAGIVLTRAGLRRPAFGAWFFGVCTVTDVAVSAVEFAARRWGFGAWMAVCAVVTGWYWWQCRKRRKRRRALALLGAKSRALIERLIVQQRQATGSAR